jgi:phosphatidylinositol alpha-mannosyltransferase
MNAHLKVGIVYDDTLDREGGIPLYVVTLGAALQRRGHEVEYLVGGSEAREIAGAPVRSLARNVSVRFNGNVLSMPVWSRGRLLEQVLDHGRYDVLHVQVPYSPLMAGRLVTRANPECAVVGTYHVASDRLLPSVGAWLLRALKLPSASRFDGMVSVSRAAAEFAARWSRMDAGRVVPNMLDLEAVRRQLPREGEAEREDIVFVGRLVRRKGVRQLIEAVALLDGGRARPTRLTIIGDGPLRAQLQQCARCLGVGDRVTFLGRIEDRRKFAALSRARIACFPSRFGESFGSVILEAFAAGADVVLAGSNPGYRALLDDDGLVDPDDTRAFAAALGLLLDNSEVRRSLGARQRASLARYDADLVVDEVLDVYLDALRRRRRGTDHNMSAETALNAAA